MRITDSRAKVGELRFHIAGTSAAAVVSGSVSPDSLREAKVTAVFDLSIPDGKGVDPSLAKGLKIRAQTTVSEKIYKSY